jgi:subtilisin family serine protease
LIHTFVNVLNGAVIDLPAQALAGLVKNPNVLSVERDAVVTASQTNAPWGLDRLDQRALPLSTTYSAPTEAVNARAFIIDTGINKTHVDFGSRVVSGFDAISSGGDGSNDCNGHGTHVAGTVGGSTYGVAKGVTLVPVRVLDCSGSGTITGVIAGLDWVASQHQAGQLDVANMSLGGGASSALDTAVNNAITRGVTVVVAAGNSNADACNSSPARVPAAITVAASDRSDIRASFSNYGSCVDVFAPGVSITSSWIGSTTATNTISGTSMASPHVAGVAALMLQLNGALTPAQLASVITANATTGIISSAGTNTPNQLVFIDSGPNPIVSSVPATPLAPVATARSKALSATWIIPADGGSPITSQTVRVFNGTTLVKTSTTTATATSLIVTGLRNGVSYTVTVSATNANGESSQSPKSNVVIPR